MKKPWRVEAEPRAADVKAKRVGCDTLEEAMRIGEKWHKRGFYVRVAVKSRGGTALHTWTG